jgi:hypothetical protein
VDEPSLLPTRNLQRVTSKRVDYGFCLQPDAEEEVLIENILRSMTDDLPSISQSSAPMLRKRGLFCHLEIKKAYGGQDPAPQLGIWSTAGLTKMSNLARESRNTTSGTSLSNDPIIPRLPCWTVDGHRWQFYVGIRQSSAETVCQRERSLDYC